MVRNTRSLVQMDLPPRYAQTLFAVPGEPERDLCESVTRFLRERSLGFSERWAIPWTTGIQKNRRLPPLSEARLSRMQLSAVLGVLGSHPAALAGTLARIAEQDPAAARLRSQAESIQPPPRTNSFWS